MASLLDEGAVPRCGGRGWYRLLIGVELLVYKVTGGGLGTTDQKARLDAVDQVVLRRP
jgi:hypothetical protein